MAQGADTFLLALFAIFLGAKVFAELFEKLTLPAVLGEILAGVILGPHALGLVPSNPAIDSIAQIGAIFVLFTVGLETRPRDLIRVGRQALGVALAGVILPFILGYLYLAWRGGPRAEAVFVAAAMVATSVGITARVLGDLRVLSSRTARIILGAAVFDDILGMVALAVVTEMAGGGAIQWLHLGVLVAEAAAFALFMILVAPRVVHRMRPGLERMSEENAPLILALVICLGLSLAATTIGMAAIVGAFFAGLMFADYAPQWNLQPPVRGIHDFLAPVFFFIMGADLNVHQFTGEVWKMAAIISALAIVSKLVGCGGVLLSEGWHNALRVGIGMMPRGEVALIIALIGLQRHVISQSAYAVVIFMTGVTTLLAPPLLRLLYPRGGTGPRGESVQEVAREGSE